MRLVITYMSNANKRRHVNYKLKPWGDTLITSKTRGVHLALVMKELNLYWEGVPHLDSANTCLSHSC